MELSPETCPGRRYGERLKWFGIFCVIAFLIIILINAFGCSSMSIAKQKKAAMLIGQQIEFIGDGVIAKCNDGTMNEDNCTFMAEIINQALDAQNAYTNALIAMQNGIGTQEQVQKALEAIQEEMAALISNAISLGIKIRKESP